MHHHFFPVWSAQDEKYGLAVLSKLPLAVVREGILTEACSKARREARGLIWVSVETETGRPIHFLNTHLGLKAKERLLQIEQLLGESWLCDRFSAEPVIIAGDFNAGPRSWVMKRLTKHFHCVQLRAVEHRPVRTFASLFPLRRIDHILVSDHFHVEGVTVLKNHFTAIASDHLPVCADLVLNPEARPGEETHTDGDVQPEKDHHAISCVRHRL
jgi:endonuclease/exonuclease/phosphatase family metal-dependent hydrolase